MAITLPDFIVETYSEYGDPSVSWINGDRRYHFWLSRDGELRENDTELHSNPLVNNPRINQHRSHDITAKKWAPLIAAIMKKVKSDDLVAKAYRDAKAKAQAEEAERVAAFNARKLAAFDAALLALPELVRPKLASLADDQKIRFVCIIQGTVQR